MILLVGTISFLFLFFFSPPASSSMLSCGRASFLPCEACCAFFQYFPQSLTVCFHPCRKATTLSEAYSVVSSFSPPSGAQTTLLKAELAFYTVVSPSGLQRGGGRKARDNAVGFRQRRCLPAGKVI